MTNTPTTAQAAPPTTAPVVTYPTAPDTTITIGDRVRSFDFDNTASCYVEGKVTAMPTMEGCQRYQIEVDRLVFRGKEDAVWAGRVYPPVNGTAHGWSGKLCMGVQKIQ